MAAGINDKFARTYNSGNPNVALVTSSRAAAGTTLSCDNLSGWPTDTVVQFSTYQKDTSNEVVAGTQIDWKGIVSGNTITSLTRITGATDGGSMVNDVVEMNPTASWADELVQGVLTHSNQDGTLKTTAVQTALTGANVPANSVDTAAIEDEAVTGDKIDFTTMPSAGAGRSYVSTSQTTTSTSFVGLTTAQAVTVTVGDSGALLVGISAEAVNNTAHTQSKISFALSGANTSSSDGTRYIYYQAYANNAGGAIAGTFLLTGLTPGSTTATLQFSVTAGTGTFSNRTISALPL